MGQTDQSPHLRLTEMRKNMPSHKIPDYAYAEDRKLKEMEIPADVACIGRHAFYNCRSLESLSLPHGGIEIEDGAFKNCPRLSRITMQQGELGCSCLKDILYDINQEVTASIHYGDGSVAVLLFPHYEYEYIANEPARIFSEVGYGTGYVYKQCFYNSQIDYPRYDGLFNQAIYSEEIHVLARILSYRLRFPHGLSPDAKKRYRQWCQEHRRELFSYYIREQDMESLRFFLENAETDVIREARELALSLQAPAAVSYAMDLLNRRGRTGGSSGRFQL